MSGHSLSFAPVIGTQPRLMIVGTMPGLESLKRQRYYAHPRNAFWPIIDALVDRSDAMISTVSAELLYQKRLQDLCERHIALWDVLHSCQREGSLDSAIRPDTIVPNNFVDLLLNYPTLRTLCFNGGKAAQLFRRHVAPELQKAQLLIDSHVLPSTSPAHASLSLLEKMRRWHTVLNEYPAK